MQHFTAMLLVTLCPILHGSKQAKLYHTIRGSSLQIFHEIKLAVMSFGLGMALGTTSPSHVQLMCSVSQNSCCAIYRNVRKKSYFFFRSLYCNGGPCFGECDLILLISFFLPDSPSVTIQQCSTPVNESDNATLYCNATGNPVPNTAWIKAGEVVSYNKRHVITNISRSESGSYECLAWNGIRNNDTKSCLVVVQCKLHLFIV